MVFTYTGALNTTLEKVRFEIGDTDSTQPMFQDGEINYIISVETGVLGAVARACEILARETSRYFDFKADGLEVSKSQQQKQYAERAAFLRARLAAGGIYVGGISEADKNAAESDTDRVKPYFKRGEFDNAGTSTGDRDLANQYN